MASENKSKVSILTNGIIKENPVLRLVLGTCSCLAVTTAVSSALGMGAAFTFVLVCSNILISLLRNVIPAKVHLPATSSSSQASSPSSRWSCTPTWTVCTPHWASSCP